MKKLCAMLCMITCIFGLTACGKDGEASESTKINQRAAEVLAANVLAPMYSQFMVEGEADAFIAEYTAEEAAYVMESGLASVAMQIGFDKISFDGAGVLGSVSSFGSGYDTIGAILEYGEAASVVKDDEIVVTVPVKGEKKSGSVEVIFSDDLFLKVQACSLNADMSTGEMMQKAGLNTLLGMGTVFCVLVLIMAIIYLFGIIPKLQKKAADKKAGKKEAEESQSTAPVAATAEAVQEELSDDFELVAVIAAAIAASEGAAGTDGFVVRSIRRANRR